MTFLRLLVETLAFYWRTNTSVVLGAMIGSAVLCGSLLVGDSMRGTLRDLSLERLGKTHDAIIGPKFFSHSLADRWRAQEGQGGSEVAACLIVRGSVTGPTGLFARDVQLVGTTPAFWRMTSSTDLDPEKSAGRVIVNRRLAEILAVEPTGRVAVRLEEVSEIPREGLLGRKDDTIRAFPFVVDAVIEDRGAGRFSLQTSQMPTSTMFLPIEKLAQAIRQPGRANVLLLSDDQPAERLAEVVTLDDMGLEFVVRDQSVLLESRERVIAPEVESAMMKVAARRPVDVERIQTYLADTLAVGDKEIPYSIVTGIEFPPPKSVGDLPIEAGRFPESGEVLINRWTADHLSAKPGDSIRLDYFVSQLDGSLRKESVTRTIAGVVAMSGLAVDRSFTPEYPGITDADTFSDWDAPFPFEIKRVTLADEEYWDEYRTAPKVFLPIADSQQLWSTRFGRLTSIRVTDPAGGDPKALQEELSRELRQALSPEEMGLALTPIRKRSLDASSGSTDFGQLFLAMSFFLIISASLLVGLLFRLNSERRSAPIGVLMAVGTPITKVRSLLLSEGLVLATIGSVLGLALAVVYARLIIVLLSTWWRDSVGTSFIEFRADPLSFVIGGLASIVISLIAIAWSTARMGKVRVPDLLQSGFSLDETSRGVRRRWPYVLAAVCLALGGGLILLGQVGIIDPLGSFFGGATLLLAGLLSLFGGWLVDPGSKDPAALVRGIGPFAIVALGVRSARRFPMRSLITAVLIALATFLVVSVGSMRHGKPARVPDRDSGNGGFAVLAQATSPLPQDLASADARLAMNVSDEADEILKSAKIFSFRVQPGDDASCLNVYQPRQPTLLGAPADFIERGGFDFASSTAKTDAERENPWRLLDQEFPDGSIPAIGDGATLQWILKKPVGSTLTIDSHQGKPVTIRIVAGLNESIFQGQLVVSESALLKHFPDVHGRRYFLIDTPPRTVPRLTELLENDLSDFGFDVETTGDVIEGYLAVQDTYMGAFQTLGGLGLMLGTLGLGAVLLRNVLARRGELALMRAIGFSNGSLAGMILAETSALLSAGLVIGTFCALLAVLPSLIKLKDWSVMIPLGVMLLVIVGLGLLSGLVAALAAIRSPVLPALRSDSG